jgi:hypothetical protein
VTGGQDEIAKLRSALTVASEQFDAGNFERAEPVYRRALLFFREGEELRHCLDRLCLLYSAIQNYASATEMSMRLLALNESEFGKTDERTITVMRSLSALLSKQGHTQKAERMKQKAMEREAARVSSPGEGEYGPDKSNEDSSEAGAGQSFSSARQSSSGITSSFRFDDMPGSPGSRGGRLQNVLEKLQSLLSAIRSGLPPGNLGLIVKWTVIVIVVCVVCKAVQAIPRNPSPLEVFLTFPHNYATSDGALSLNFIDQSTASFEERLKVEKASHQEQTKATQQALPATETMPMSQMLQDWRDIIAIVASSLFEKQYWLQRAQDIIIDADDRIYYAIEGPESKLIAEMRLIQNTVHGYYELEGRYPEALTESLVQSYKNPYTGKKIRPLYQTLRLGSLQSDDSVAASARDALYDAVKKGLPWPDEPTSEPGTIRCCAVTLQAKGSETYDFLMRAVGRDGKYLTSTFRGSTYVVSLNHQDSFGTAPAALPFNGIPVLKSRHVWLFSPDVKEQERYFLMHGLFLVFIMLAMMEGIPLIFYYQQGWAFERRTVLKALLYFMLAIYSEVNRYLP